MKDSVTIAEVTYKLFTGKFLDLAALFYECVPLELEYLGCFKARGWYLLIQLFIYFIFSTIYLNKCFAGTESEEENDEPEDRQPSPEPIQDSPSNANCYEPHPVR